MGPVDGGYFAEGANSTSGQKKKAGQLDGINRISAGKGDVNIVGYYGITYNLGRCVGEVGRRKVIGSSRS
jgi:hypothetical protein